MLHGGILHNLNYNVHSNRIVDKQMGITLNVVENFNILSNK